MAKPVVAIVGRPNVGKSLLFNRIADKRLAIVDELEGVTRDRVYADASYLNNHFTLIDTGGVDPLSKASFNEKIQMQTKVAIDEADVVILVVDGQAGPALLDKKVLKILLKQRKKIVLAVNKIDDASHDHCLSSFYSLGIDDFIGISSMHNCNIFELLEKVFKHIEFSEEIEKKDDKIKVAFIGKTNVGKSTLLNYLVEEERSIISPIAGTTRDCIDVIYKDKYLLIDTAGVRRKKSESSTIEKFASIRTKNAIDRADICLFLLDAEEGITSQDLQNISLIEKKGKACILLLNKWDLIKNIRMEHYRQRLFERCPFLKHCPVIFISAKTGRNIDKIFISIDEVYKSFVQRINTHELNKCIERAMQRCHPAMIKGKRLRIYYATQINYSPPIFALFVNYPKLLMDTYKKYLISQMRKHFSFDGIPIKLEIKGKQKQKEDDF